VGLSYSNQVVRASGKKNGNNEFIRKSSLFCVLKAENTTSKRVGRMLDILLRRGPRVPQLLYRAFIETQNPECAEKLTPYLQQQETKTLKRDPLGRFDKRENDIQIDSHDRISSQATIFIFMANFKTCNSVLKIMCIIVIIPNRTNRT
jgi:hypothetical protein